MDTNDTNENFIKEINNYEITYRRQLELTIKDLPNFSLKLNDIYDLTEDMVNKGCKKEIEELNKNLKYDFLSSNQFDPLPGKEKEANIAYDNFNSCSFYPYSIIDTFHNIEETLIKMNKKQMEYCKQDCIKKSNNDILIAKNCVKDCIDYAFNYSRKASYDIIDNALDFTEKEIKRINIDF